MKIAMKSSAFEDAYVAGFRDIFENKIVFNREIELTIKSVETGLVHAEVMLSGNEAGHIGGRRLNGGAISVALDSIGSAAVFAAVGGRHIDESPDERLARFSKLGTIDLHVHHLSNGCSGKCVVRARCLSIDSRLGTSEIELWDAKDTLVAKGIGTYIVS